MSKIRKGDEVVVLSGNERGKRGRVVKVLDRGDMVLVEGVAMIKRHTKPTQKDPQGGIKEKERPVPMCKLALWNAKNNRKVRVNFQTVLEDGKKVKTRYSHKLNEALD